MSARRSLGSALEGTPTLNDLGTVATEFIKSGRIGSDARERSEHVQNNPPIAEVQPPTLGKEARPRRKPALSSESVPDVITFALTTRIDQRLSNALQRASLERRMRKLKLQTQREIVEAALEDWLQANGYLD
jgi:hypothetical protein